MTQLETTTSDLGAMRQQVMQRLTRFRRRVRAHLFTEGAAKVLGLVVALALMSLVIDRGLRLTVPTRVTLLIMAIGAVGYFIWRWIIAPLSLPMDFVDLAAAADRAVGHGSGGNGATRNGNGNGLAKFALAPRVATVLELPELLRGQWPPSPAMVEHAVQRSFDSMREIDFTQRLDQRRLQKNLGVVVTLLLIPLIIALLAPFTAKLWAKRWLLASNEPWPQKTYLMVAGLKDGRIVVARGEPYVLRVSPKPGSVPPESVTLSTRDDRGESITGQFTKFGPTDYRYDFSSLNVPLKVFIEGGDDVLDPFLLDPVDRPRVTSLQLVSQHPTDPQPSTHTFAGEDADMAFLPQTKIDLTFATNVPIEEAHLKSATTKPSGSDLKRIDDTHFTVAWVHQKAVQLEVELVSRGANLMSVPMPISVGLKTDAAPRVNITYTGVRQRITPQAHVPLTILARDDYGVVKIDLTTKVDFPDPTTQGPPVTNSVNLMPPATQPTELEVQQQHLLDVNAMKLGVGSLLSLAGQATDACYQGPQTGSSRTVTFRIVAPEELFREILLRQQGERAKFRKAIEDAQGIREQLATLVSDEALAQVVRNHRASQREVVRIATSLTESITEMKLNALGGDEAFDLMQKNVLGPMEPELHDGPMTEQRQGLESMNGATDAQKLADAANREDLIINQMNDILKQMSQWDSFVDVLNQLNAIIKVQQGVNTGTDKLKNKEAENVFEKR